MFSDAAGNGGLPVCLLMMITDTTAQISKPPNKTTERTSLFTSV